MIIYCICLSKDRLKSDMHGISFVIRINTFLKGYTKITKSTTTTTNELLQSALLEEVKHIMGDVTQP